VAGSFHGPFFVWYGDNLSTCRLDHLWRCHRAHRGAATLALYYRRDPAHSGIAVLDRHGRITRFIEKPRADQIFSRWVSAGIFVLEPPALAGVPAGTAVDFGRHVFPDLLAKGARLHGYRMGPDEKLVWIDRPEDLRRAESRWKRLAVSFEAS
jgi:mannose-1-phosphate guanylyltransferase / phosphomannomutase